MEFIQLEQLEVFTLPQLAECQSVSIFNESRDDCPTGRNILPHDIASIKPTLKISEIYEYDSMKFILIPVNLRLLDYNQPYYYSTWKSMPKQLQYWNSNECIPCQSKPLSHDTPSPCDFLPNTILVCLVSKSTFTWQGILLLEALSFQGILNS